MGRADKCRRNGRRIRHITVTHSTKLLQYKFLVLYQKNGNETVALVTTENFSHLPCVSVEHHYSQTNVYVSVLVTFIEVDSMI